MSQIDDNGTTPPIGEEIHMPAPSILPLVNAAALALAIVSITLSLRLQRRADRKSALRTYLFSLGYLAALFVAMVLDAQL